MAKPLGGAMPLWAPTGILLSGPSSAGKSTLARQLQEVLPDPWLILDAGQPPWSFPRHRPEFVTLEWDRALREGCCRSARAFLESGLNVLLEQALWDLWGTSMARRVLGDLRFFVVGVTCTLEAAEAREFSRGDRYLGVASSDRAELEVSTLGADFSVETTKRGPDEGTEIGRGPCR